MPVSTAISWLKVASAVLMIGFGLMFAIAAFPPTSGLATLFIDMLIWPVDGGQTLYSAETRIIVAIGGGITVGWGVLVWQVASHVMPTQPETARRLLLTSLITWFVIDSACSVLAGVMLNAGANVVLLAVFLLPLVKMNPS